MKKLIAAFFLTALAGSLFAQRLNPNKFPSPESVTYDNNGNDLSGFINKHNGDFEAKGSAVNEAGTGDWGYVQVKYIKAPGVDKKGVLNYVNAFDVTLMLYKTRNSAKATWWSREYNLGDGKMQYFPVGADGKLPYDNVKYTDVINELQNKGMTIVEFTDSILRPKDFDIMLKNCLFIKNGTVKDVNDYKAIVNFYTKFLTRFTNVNDPVLDDKSFITFVKGASAEYVGYFNVVNGKLSGRLELLDATFERDRIAFVNNIVKQLTGNIVYEYGDDKFGIEKIIKLRAEKMNLKIEPVKTNSTRKFNQDF